LPYKGIFGSKMEWMALCLVLLLCGHLHFSRAEDDTENERVEEEEANIETQNPPPTSKQSSPPEEEFDKEEFVGYESIQETKKEKPLNEILKIDIDQAPVERTYYLEAFYIAFIVLFGANFLYGKKKNETLAKQWVDSIAKVLKSNFSKVGETNREVVSIVKESNNIFRLKTTGRINCVGMQVTLTLRKRHDLLALLMEIVNPLQDTVQFDILMNDESMDTFVFAIVKKKEEKKFRTSAKDIETFTAPAISYSKLPSSFCVCSELEELLPILLHNEVLLTLSKYEDDILKIHMSDQGILTPQFPRSISMVCKLTQTKVAADYEKWNVIMKMSIHFIDLLAKTILSKTSKQKAEKNRSHVATSLLKQTHIQRQEAAQQRKLEKIQKEKAELENLPEDVARKKEEKMAKKEAKRKQPKFKVVYG